LTHERRPREIHLTRKRQFQLKKGQLLNNKNRVVSDELYDNSASGGTLIIKMAVGNHRNLLEQLNASENITREERYALIAEMAVGVTPKRAGEIEEQCRQDVSEGYKLLHTVWRNLEVSNGKTIAMQYSLARK